MKANKNRVSLEFAPETKFEMSVVPFRASLENDFDGLKSRLIARQLDELKRPDLNPTVRRAANEAAELARITFYPLLVFPALFEEKVTAALRRTRLEAKCA
jgi:hypothetical protein